MLRQLLKSASSIYTELCRLDAETNGFSQTNCSSRKDVKYLCEALKHAGYLNDFETYALQIAAVRADHTTWPLCECGTKVKMYNGIFRTFCSRKCGLTSVTTKQKCQQTSILRYGVGHHWAAGLHRDENIKNYISAHGAHPQVKGKEKRLLTWKNKYGCHPMQTPAVLKKAMRNRMQIKPFQLPSGKIVELMGHEPRALQLVLEEGMYQESDFQFEDVPIIQYSNGKRYFPDFYLPKDNLLVEVKSRYTAFQARYFEANVLKEQATKAYGYNFQVWIFEPKTNSLEVRSSFLENV